MGDMGDIYRSMKERTKAHHHAMLSKADTTGWRKHTPFHFSRFFRGARFDWWPSGGKGQFRGHMIYGHAKVNAMIAKLMAGGSRCPLSQPTVNSVSAS